MTATGTDHASSGAAAAGGHPHESARLADIDPHAPLSVDAVLDRLEAAHRSDGARAGLRRAASRLATAALGVLFIDFADAGARTRAELAADLDALLALLAEAIRASVDPPPSSAGALTASFAARLPAIREALLDDAEAIRAGDPAAQSVQEVILAYPGFLATAIYRLAHELHGAAPLLARLLTEVAHRDTGIDIHPGARIGRSFAIDHGTGVVIGETSVLGERVRIYQGVTLGAARVEKQQAATKRHPTIGDDVVIYANATILGGETVIGRGCRIGGNVWLTRSVPPYSVVTPTARVERLAGMSETGNDLIEFNI